MNLSIHPWIAWHYGGWLSTGFSPCVGVSYLADKGRGGKTTSGNGQAWSSASPRGQWRTGKNGKNWLQNYLWCPNDLRGQGIDDDDEVIWLFDPSRPQRITSRLKCSICCLFTPHASHQTIISPDTNPHNTKIHKYQTLFFSKNYSYRYCT